MVKNKDPELSFEEFVKQKNSFHLHFAGNPGEHLIGDAYRKGKAYQGCLKAHRKEFTKLIEELGAYYNSGRPIFKETLRLQRKLYEAYKLMRPYAANDHQLFQ